MAKLNARGLSQRERIRKTADMVDDLLMQYKAREVLQAFSDRVSPVQALAPVLLERLGFEVSIETLPPAHRNDGIWIRPSDWSRTCRAIEARVPTGYYGNRDGPQLAAAVQTAVNAALRGAGAGMTVAVMAHSTTGTGWEQDERGMQERVQRGDWWFELSGSSAFDLIFNPDARDCQNPSGVSAEISCCVLLGFRQENQTGLDHYPSTLKPATQFYLAEQYLVRQTLQGWHSHCDCCQWKGTPTPAPCGGLVATAGEASAMALPMLPAKRWSRSAIFLP